MTKERYIYEKTSKKRGKYYEVKIKAEINGKRTDKSFGKFYFADYPAGKKDALKQAVKCRSQALDDIEYNRLTVNEMTVDECFNEALKLLIDSKKNADRKKRMYQKIQTYSPHLLNKSVKAVTTEDVLLNLRAVAENHSAGVIADVKTVWHQIFQTAQLKEIPVIDRTLMIKTPKSKVPKKKREYACTIEDVNQILECLETYGIGQKNPRHTAIDVWYMIMIMLYTGMRPQEVFALSRDEIDLDAGEITITQSVGSTRSETRQIIPTKTDQSVRPIPIASELRPILEELLEERDSELLFLAPDGQPYEIDTLDAFLFHMRKKYNLPRFTLYMCRHLFATGVYKMAVNKKAAQKLMGHASESMTLHYVNDDPEERRQLIEQLKYS